MERIIFLIAVCTLLSLSIYLYWELKKANRTIDIFMQDEPIYRSLQLEFANGKAQKSFPNVIDIRTYKRKIPNA